MLLQLLLFSLFSFLGGRFLYVLQFFFELIQTRLQLCVPGVGLVELLLLNFVLVIGLPLFLVQSLLLFLEVGQKSSLFLLQFLQLQL